MWRVPARRATRDLEMLWALMKSALLHQLDSSLSYYWSKPPVEKKTLIWTGMFTKNNLCVCVCVCVCVCMHAYFGNGNYWWTHSRPIQFNFSISSWPDVSQRYGICVCECMCLFFYSSSLLFPLFLPYFHSPSITPFPFSIVYAYKCVCFFCPLSLFFSFTFLSIFLLPERWWQLQRHTAFLHISHVFLMKRLMLLFTIRLCSTPACSHTHDEAQPLGKV